MEHVLDFGVVTLQKIFLLSLIFILSNVAFASSDAKVSNSVIIKNYLKLQKQYFKEICSPKIDHRAQELYKSYLGDGLYIPFLKDGSLDVVTITDHLSLFDKKIKWINQMNLKVKAIKNFKQEFKILNELKKQLDELRDVYHDYYRANNFEKKKEFVNKSKIATQNFIKKLSEFILKTDILHTFEFPLDHFYLRTEYDKYKDIDTDEGRKKTNQIYFLRKLVEEGAVDRQKGRTDLNIRALINSVYMRIDSYNEIFMDNALLYDVEGLLKNYEETFNEGTSTLKARFNNWLEKSQKDLNFYNDLLSKQKSKDEFLITLFADKNKARYALSDFIYEKEALVYKFWTTKDVLYQKLFALETILIHEVGRLDDDYGTERSDVLRVVKNRFNIPEYTTLLPKETITQKLLAIGLTDTSKYPWLNILFKQGEFSFTYFFIPASRGIFCPDQSKSATKLRVQNLKLSLKVIAEENDKFQASRYFSRASMLGRIDMAKLWNEYSSIGERPGPRIIKDAKLQSHLKNSNYKYLYNFTFDNITYEVLRMKGIEFVYSPRPGHFFGYRNPHHFNYFVKNRPY